MRTKTAALLLAACTLWGGTFCTAGAANFTDVASGAWYAEAVGYCTEHGLMTGVSDTAFAPEDTMTRAMLVTILYRQAGSPAVSYTVSFSDVAAGVWYAQAVAWADANGVAGGYGDGRFGPEEPVTREQMAAILWRRAGSPEAQDRQMFADQTMISAYAVDAVDWARETGIISGRGENRFEPAGQVTRAESAMMLYRWLSGEDNTQQTEPGQDIPSLRIEAGGRTFTVVMEDNPTARAFLEQCPMTLSMTELNGNEKYYDLENALPADPQQVGQIHAGDLMLYRDNCVVLFYEDFPTTYAYTRLGSVEDPAGLADALGNGAVSVSFEVQS